MVIINYLTDSFLREKAFPITFKEYNLVFKSIPNGILELMKSYNKQNDIPGVNLTLYVNGMDIMSSNCTNKHIRNSFLNAKKITPRGKFFGNSLFMRLIGIERCLFLLDFVSQTKLGNYI